MLSLTPEQFTQMLKQKEKEIAHLISTQLPEIVGVMAVNHFKLNFQNEAWGRVKWKEVQRGWTRTGVRDDHKILTNTSDLGRSIEYKPESGKVTIFSDKIYAAIHNYGGKITVTEKMKKWAWAMYYKTKSENYKALALTKKSHITIPQRQFIGEDEELNNKIKAKIEQQLEKIFSK